MKNTDFNWFNNQNTGIETAKDVINLPSVLQSLVMFVASKMWKNHEPESDCVIVCLSANNEVSTNLTYFTIKQWGSSNS